MKQNALTVEEFLKEEKLKLNYMNILSVQENAILQEKESNLHPSLNQIIVARKPFKGTLVDNILEYGVFSKHTSPNQNNSLYLVFDVILMYGFINIRLILRGRFTCSR